MLPNGKYQGSHSVSRSRPLACQRSMRRVSALRAPVVNICRRKRANKSREKKGLFSHLFVDSSRAVAMRSPSTRPCSDLPAQTIQPGPCSSPPQSRVKSCSAAGPPPRRRRSMPGSCRFSPRRREAFSPSSNECRSPRSSCPEATRWPALWNAAGVP
jgi:hypothetical protein